MKFQIHLDDAGTFDNIQHFFILLNVGIDEPVVEGSFTHSIWIASITSGIKEYFKYQAISDEMRAVFDESFDDLFEEIYNRAYDFICGLFSPTPKGEVMGILFDMLKSVEYRNSALLLTFEF